MVCSPRVEAGRRWPATDGQRRLANFTVAAPPWGMSGDEKGRRSCGTTSWTLRRGRLAPIDALGGESSGGRRRAWRRGGGTQGGGAAGRAGDGLGLVGARFGSAFIVARAGAAHASPGSGSGAGLAGLPWLMGHGGPGWAGAGTGRLSPRARPSLVG
jgi:hypothetical protein